MNVQEDLKMCNKDGVWTLHGLKEMGGTANSVDSMVCPVSGCHFFIMPPNKRTLCKMTFPSRIDGSQKIVVIIPDPSHVSKKIRNAAAQSDPSFKDAPNTFSRLLVWNGYEIIWQHWIDAYEWSKNRDLNPLSPHRHLTCESIHLTTIGKMRNNFAYETLNDRMLTLMKAYMDSPQLALNRVKSWLVLF